MSVKKNYRKLCIRKFYVNYTNICYNLLINHKNPFSKQASKQLNQNRRTKDSKKKSNPEIQKT